MPCNLAAQLFRTSVATVLITAAEGMFGKFDSKMPEFSFDTLPVAYHGANYGSYSSEAISLLAKFPVVTLEKCQGWKTLNPPCSGFGCTSCCEENVYATVGRSIKALNNRTKIIAYFHSNKAMPWYHIDRFINNTNSCYNGDGLNETAPCNNTGPPENAPYFDFRKPGGMKAYTDGCLNMTKTGMVDGCFVDGCLKIEAPVGKGAQKDFMAAKMKMLKQLQQAVPGPLICGSGGGLNVDMAASQVQSFSAKHAGWWGNMLHMNTSASQGYMFEAHGHQLCYNNNVSSPEFQQEYAAFLMFAQRWTYHICGSWCGSDPVWPKAFDLPLGEPVNNATTADGQVWSRRFQHGTEVFFNKTSTAGWVHWGPSAQRAIRAWG
jgi:hypothetical protein